MGQTENKLKKSKRDKNTCHCPFKTNLSEPLKRAILSKSGILGEPHLVCISQDYEYRTEAMQTILFLVLLL